MRSCIIIYCLLTCVAAAFAQFPVKIDFEQEPAVATTAGISGKALDLGHVERRLAQAIPNPLEGAAAFTVMLWVKAAADSEEAYDIISAVTDVTYGDKGWKYSVMNGKERSANSYNGWKLGVQQNGAWRFTARTVDYMYTYEPTPFRQTIRDGNWHLLAVSYDRQISELRFFYDGDQVAVYHVPELQSMGIADTLVIGNSADNDPDYRTREWHTFYGQIDDIQIFNKSVAPSDIRKHYEDMTKTPPRVMNSGSVDSLKVTSANIFHGGNERGKETGRNNLIELLKKENAAIYILQETYASGEVIADALGYQLYLISSNLSIISKYPIGQTYRVFKPFNCGGAAICLPDGNRINTFAVWLTHLPEYKEHFLSEKPDVNRYLEEERRRRGEQAVTLLQELTDYIEDTDTTPLIVGGDFNSGSHLDWTAATAPRHAGYIIPWTVSIAFADARLTDSFRAMHPDPAAEPGITWSPQQRKKRHIRDRIDYIYYKGRTLQPVKSYTVFTHTGPGQFPSDHAMVSTIFYIDR